MKALSLFTAVTFLAVSLSMALPPELTRTTFADATITPSPACLCAHPDGSVFVGVDLNGSLGKGAGKGRIVKLVDTDNDGVADRHTVFAHIDNPRGLIADGDQLYVLYSVISAETDVMTGMHLGVLEDKNHDGIADGEPKVLVRNISTLKHNQDRGADHTTNGIQMGIDGWIYIALGDFGFVDAEGTDGTKFTKLGGGIVRVRPDGSEMEMYTHNLRNIYDVAIDPFMNIFTRGNTNDGGGWNVRFIHQIQSGNYGYPTLYINFTDEIIPALADLGGGSGVGALFFNEPGWPEKYSNVPMMGDWGRSQLYIHRITPDGPTFTQADEPFIRSRQISDVDVDGSGRLYLSAWAGAGYKGNPEKGYIERVVPASGWSYQPFPELAKLDSTGLLKLLTGDSAKARLHTQQEILRRGDDLSEKLNQFIEDDSLTNEARAAAIFTLAQLGGETAIPSLVKHSKSESAVIRELSLRALADRKPLADQIPVEPLLAGLKDENPRVQVAAAVGLGRMGRGADELLSVAIPPVPAAATDTESSSNDFWRSEVVKGSGKVEIDVDVSDFKSISLIVEPNGANGNDHVAWVNPRIVQADGSEIDLTTLKANHSESGWGKNNIDKDCAGQPLQDTEGNPLTGIGSHAPSLMNFTIPEIGAGSRFRATGIFTKGSRGRGEVKFVVSPVADVPDSSPKTESHAIPNSAIVLPHVAVQSLVQIRAIDECLAAIDSPSQDGALWALRLMHDQRVVDGLAEKLKAAQDSALKQKIITALLRLRNKEAPYDGSWWWRTKPDTRGPYYVLQEWPGSSVAETAIREAFANASATEKEFIIAEANRNRSNLPGIGGVEKLPKSKQPRIGDTSIEDIVLSLDKLKGSARRGKGVLAKMACVGCHNVTPDQPIKGPDLAGLKMTKADLAESIIKPAATMAPSWVNLIMKDGTELPGTIVSEINGEITIHNIAGIPSTVKAADVAKRDAGPPLMGPHLADELTLQQFADVIAYIQSMKRK